MAHNVEPMDVDSEFDNKENSYHHSNVQPCTEKGYEELDVSELNMKLRYSVTPASSPMSKSYTANCPEYRSFESGDDSPNIIKNDNANLTRSLNSNLKTDNVTKSLKLLPLQMISTEQFNDSKKNASVLRPLDTVVTSDNANITVTVSKPIDIDENLSLPSSSSSTAQTPEATTPTKEIPKTDDGSPIMRGLKSVLNMFRSSQSPIPPAEGEDATKQEVLSPAEMTVKPAGSTAVMASTPISAHRKKETSPSKRNSPYKESIVFNDDLEKELQWKDETTILFSQERIPIHKLFFQHPVESKNTDKIENEAPHNHDKTLNSTVEYMDISFNDSALGDQTLQPDGNKSIGNKTDIACESDGEFVDCETTFTKNESCVIDDKVYEENDHVENLNVTKNVPNNGSRSKLNPIILNTTQDILDATLSITPEDIASQIIDRVQELPATLVIPSVNCDPLDNVQDSDKLNEIETMKVIVENKEEYANKIEEKNFDYTAVDFGSEILNLTNTSENIPVEIKMALDKPQKIFADNANVTQSSDNAHVGNKTITDQVSGPNSENLNVTHTFESSHVECNLLEHNDADGSRNTIFNISNEGEEISVQDNVNDKEILIVECNVKEVIMPKIEAVPNPAENINATNDCNILTVNKAEDHNNVLENNNLITEHEFALEHYELNITKEITNISNMEKIISTVESANKPFEGNDMLHDNYVSSEEKSVVELPADIPLPDEDDLEKETTVKMMTTIELSGEFICTPPPDLVDVLKLKTENTKDNNVIFSINNEEISKPVLTTHDAVKEAINDRETVLQFSQTKDECHDVNEDSNLKNDNLRLCGTPQVLLLQNKILPLENTNVHTDQVPISSVKLNETITSMEPFNNKIVPNDMQKAKLLDINLPMHKNESVCDFKVLPDVINQIINSPCNEIPQSVDKINEIVEQQFESSIGDSTKQNVKSNLSPVTENKPTVTDSTPQKTQLDTSYGTDVLISKTLAENAKPVKKTSAIVEKQYELTIGDSTEQNVKSYQSSTTEIISSILENTAADTIPTITDSKLQETELDKNNDTDLSTPKNVDEIAKSIEKTSAMIEKDLETSIGDSTKQNFKSNLSPVAKIKPTVTDNTPQTTQLEKKYGLDVSTPKNVDADAEKVEKASVIIEKQFESSIGDSTKQNVKNNLSSDTQIIPSILENIATETKHTITNNTKETDLEKNNGTDVSMPKNVDETAKSIATIEKQLESRIGDSTEPNIRSKLTSATEIMPSILDNTLQETELEKNNGTDVSTPKNVDDIVKSDDKINKIVEQQFQSSIGDSADQNVMCYLSSVTEFKPSFTDNISQETKLEKNNGAEISTSKIVIEDIPIVPKIQQIAINMSIDEENEDPRNVINSQQEAEIVTPNQTNNNMQFEKELAPAEKNNISSYDNTTEPESKVLDEEIVVSENNSPFVCVLAETEVKTDDIENSFTTKTRIVSTPPRSPPITSKGYNFNFDEMDDPFDTNAKIRMSPTPDSPNKQADSKVMEQKIEKQAMTKKEKNRRKSQPERKRALANKTKLNSTFNNSITDTRAIEKPIEKVEALQSKSISVIGAIKSEPLTSVFEKEDKEVQDIIKRANENIEIKLQEALKAGNKRKSSNVEELVEAVSVVAPSLTDSITELKTSSEQSTYFSAGTSSSESLKSRNVFNIPEIDDMNFNPFATKSKMRQSPPLVQDIDNPFATRSKMMTSPIGDKSLSSKIHLNHTKTTNINATNPLLDDKMETEPMEKDTSNNICDTTNSSKTTDERDATIKEINTEDEDTIEGPFLDPEDLQNDDKNIVCDTENDMMQFNELPAQTKEETPEADELFIDAEAFQFLLNQNKSNTVVDSGKESLFLKFDPLFAKRVSSDSVLSALTKLQKRQSTPVKLKPKQKEVVSPIAGPSNMNITRDIDLNMSEELNDDFNVTVSKPMMVVPPAINSVTPRNKSITPTRSNRRSITFTSPAMAVIDRLLSLSANNSPVHDNTYTQVSREQNEADIALSQLRELLAEKEIHVYNLRSESKELKDRLSTMESTVRSLETESQGRLKKINDLNDQLAEKTKINRSMAAVVEEYERTIASLIAETEQDKKRHAEERAKLISERDEQTAHLASMEVSFSDLHSKYEKSKHVILSCKANEEAYKKSIKDFEENLSKMQTNYELLKQHATSKLNHANQELEKMNRSHEAEVLKLNAMIKRKELHITSLEETLTQKTKANEELTAICDELINKVG